MHHSLKTRSLARISTASRRMYLAHSGAQHAENHVDLRILFSQMTESLIISRVCAQLNVRATSHKQASQKRAKRARTLTKPCPHAFAWKMFESLDSGRAAESLRVASEEETSSKTRRDRSRRGQLIDRPMRSSTKSCLPAVHGAAPQGAREHGSCGIWHHSLRLTFHFAGTVVSTRPSVVWWPVSNGRRRQSGY